MTVIARQAVDGAAKLQRLDDSRGAQVEHLGHGSFDVGFRDSRRAERVHVNRQRTRDADGIGQLHLAARRQAGGHDVLGNPTCRVRSRAVDLRAVLARKRAAAVAAHAAVRVDDDLAAGQARVAHRPADDETARRVDEHLGAFPLHALGGEHRRDHVLDNVSLDLRHFDISPVLSGHEDLFHRDRLVVDVAHGHLRLPIGIQIRQRAVLAHLRQALGQTVRQENGHGHERGRFVACISEHDALVARADAVVRIIASDTLLGFVRLVDAHGDVSRLGVHVVGNGACVCIEAHLCPGIADVANHIAHDGVHVYVSFGADLAHNRDDARGRERLDGAAHLVYVGGTSSRRHIAFGLQLRFLGQDGIEDGVGHLVAQFVGMAFRHRLGREQVCMRFGHACLHFVLESQSGKPRPPSILSSPEARCGHLGDGRAQLVGHVHRVETQAAPALVGVARGD